MVTELKISEILSKSVDVVTGQPEILLPYLAPIVVSLIATWGGVTSMLGWGVGRFYPLGRTPLRYFWYLITSLRTAGAGDLAVWIAVLILLAICVALTIVMSDARLSGRTMKVGEAFDATLKMLPLFIIAFLISWLLKFCGLFVFWVGLFVPSVLLIFAGQVMILEKKDIFDSFSRSYDIAKGSWVEILLLLFVFLIILVLVRTVPLVGILVACLLMGYSTVVFTVMYRDRSRVGPVKRRTPSEGQ
ncbi:MAG: hypothetical protein HXS52_11340 [Theionarchaea archaeon]|nr:hypothetical protein [Theionarchaea archaeon]